MGLEPKQLLATPDALTPPNVHAYSTGFHRLHIKLKVHTLIDNGFIPAVLSAR